jgi:small neutral amino acid transporter SnatA (MarC family)
MDAFYIVTAALTVGSGTDYFLYGLRLLRNKRRERAATSPPCR